MNIVEVLTAWTTERPDAPALIVGSGRRARTISFAGLDHVSARVASMLEGAGVGAGDAVLIFHPMSIELYAILLGVFRMGATAMFLDPSAGREHIERCCALGNPRALVASAKAHLLRVVSPALRRIPVKFSIGAWMPGARRFGASDRCAPRVTIESAAADTPALLTFTSGSTGEPKAAIRSHGFLLAQHAALVRSIALEPGEIDLATLPVFVLANLGSGVTSVVPDADLRRPGAIAPGPVVAQIAERSVGRAAASPAFFERIVEYCEAHSSTLDGLRKLYTGGAPVFPRLLDRLQRVAPRAEVVAVYGSTEAEPIAEIGFDAITDGDRCSMREGKGLLSGPPVDEIDLRILPDRWGEELGPFSGDDFEKMSLGSGSTGEIVVAGDHVLRGYLGGRGDRETKFTVDGRVWHRTGDAGYLDGDGRVWLMGRCSARVEDECGRLYPFAVECAVSEDARIRRAAFLEHRGARVLVVETGDGNLDRTAIEAALAWASIDDVCVVARIPVDKRHNAKIDYPALRALVDRVRPTSG